MENLHLARAIWKKFKPMILESKPRLGAPRGRPRSSERLAFLGVCYLVWSGCSWRALPRQFGRRSTVHRYFQKWRDSGLFRKLWQTVLVFLCQLKKLANKVHVVDGSTVMVQHLSKKVAFVSSKFRPKRAIKYSILVDSKGIPLASVLGKANEHDTNLLEPTISQQIIARLNCRETALLGDKGYVGPRQQMMAIIHGYQPIFCPRRTQQGSLSKGQRKTLKAFRWVVERSISWIKSNRRVKFCYERSLASYHSLLDLACLMISFKKAYF